MVLNKKLCLVQCVSICVRLRLGSSVFGSCIHSKVQLCTGHPLIQVKIVSLNVYM